MSKVDRLLEVLDGGLQLAQEHARIDAEFRGALVEAFHQFARRG